MPIAISGLTNDQKAVSKGVVRCSALMPNRGRRQTTPRRFSDDA
jgi:hypothetical protein